MRRTFVVAVALLSLASCAAAERPEGIVERWLIALNQGSAGEPLRYAKPNVTRAVQRAARIDGPGTFDAIEVGRRRPCHWFGFGPCGVAMVPFRLGLVDGGTIRLVAIVQRRGSEPDAPLVVAVITGPGADPAPLPSEGGPPIGSASSEGWLAALGVAIALSFIGEVVMRLVRPRPG